MINGINTALHVFKVNNEETSTTSEPCGYLHYALLNQAIV